MYKTVFLKYQIKTTLTIMTIFTPEDLDMFLLPPL